MLETSDKEQKSDQILQNLKNEVNRVLQDPSDNSNMILIGFILYKYSKLLLLLLFDEKISGLDRKT